MAYQVRLKVLGTRGIHNTSGAEYAVYGGNTTSIYVTDNERHFFIQAGFGMNDIGDAIIQDSQLKQKPIHVLLSDFHWENTQGLPFFTPIHFKSCSVDVVAPSKSHNFIDKLETVAGPAFTPFNGMSSLTSQPEILSFDQLKSKALGPWTIKTRQLTSPLTKEPVIAYRLMHSGGFDLVYANPGSLTKATKQNLVEFARDTKILFLGAFAPRSEIVPAYSGRMPFEEAMELSKCLPNTATHILGYAPSMTDEKLKWSEKNIQDSLGSSTSTQPGVIHFCRQDQEIFFEADTKTLSKAS